MKMDIDHKTPLINLNKFTQAMAILVEIEYVLEQVNDGKTDN